MKTVGIIIAKENSNRFPGKNYFLVDGVPMFCHNIIAFRYSEYIDDIYVATDSERIKKFCFERHIKTIHRGKNISHDDQPWFDVLKYSYMRIDKKYDLIVSIAANTIGHNSDSVDKIVKKMIKNPDIHEIRSFDKHGNQSGIFAFREDVILNGNISNHMGAINSDGKEIHYREDLDG